MKKILLYILFTFICQIINAHEQMIKLLNGNHIIDQIETSDFANLSEEETIVKLHVEIGFMQTLLIFLKKDSEKLSKKNPNCNLLVSKEWINKDKTRIMNRLNTINYKNPKIESLKKEQIESMEQLFDLTLSREKCETQQKLFEEQKAALDKAQEVN